MKLTDFNRLKKFMALTFSENDPEALSGLRQANKLLAAEGIDWNRVLDRMVTLEVEDAPSDPSPVNPDKDSIKKALQKVLDDCQPGSFRNMLLDYEAQFNERGTLSKRQMEVLFNAAANVGKSKHR